MGAMLKLWGHLFLVICYGAVHAQETATANRPVINSLAIGGMVQGLLDMQIRPQGGFYEERYKEIFPENGNVPLATADSIERLHTVSSSTTNRDIVSEDGRSLTEASSGTSENPCFDEQRIFRNRLLFLVCSLRLHNMILLAQAP